MPEKPERRMLAPLPRLWHFRVSHYNEKVRWALDYKHWPHLRRALVPGFHVPRVRLLTGQTRLPVIRLDGRILVDSSAIIAELERLRPDPPLYPGDPTARARALALEDYFDEEVAPDLRRLFWWSYLDRPSDCARMATDGFGPLTRLAWRASWPLMRPLFRRNMGLDRVRIDRTRGRLDAYFGRLESEIGPDGYLVGGRFTIADLTAASVMTAIIRLAEFSYPLPEPWPPALSELRASMAGRPGFRWVLDIYSRHRGASFELASGARASELEATG